MTRRPNIERMRRAMERGRRYRQRREARAFLSMRLLDSNGKTVGLAAEQPNGDFEWQATGPVHITGLGLWSGEIVDITSVQED